jgi:hypothetical protein
MSETIPNTDPNPYPEIKLFNFDRFTGSLRKFGSYLINRYSTEPKPSHSTHFKATETIKDVQLLFNFENYYCDGGEYPNYLGEYPEISAEQIKRPNRWDSEGTY